MGGEDEVQEEVKTEQAKKVQIQRVGDIEAEGETFTSYGKVVSSTKVEVSPETSGQISSVNYRLGSFVSRDQIVVELKNTTERQAVLQANASLSQAQANLEKVNSSQPETLSNLEAEVERTQNNLNDQKRQLTVILSGLNTDLLSIMENTINPLFSNEADSTRKFVPPSKSQVQEQVIEREYDQIISQISAYTNSQSRVDLYDDLITDFTKYIQDIINLVDTVTESQTTSAETISAWKTSLASAKSTLESKQTQIISQNNSVFSSQKALDVALNNFNEQKDSGQSIDTTIAQSGVEQARASLALAQINLEKTFVRSPISGVVSDIDVRIGQLVGPSSPIFTIESDNILRIDTSLSSEDIKKVKIGDKVVVDGQYSGTISNISPSIGQDGKIEVRVLLDGDVTLVSGLGVSVYFDNSTDQQNTEVSEFIVPIEAVFVRNEKTYVYVVDSQSITVEREIEVESLFGDRIVVKSGLSVDDRIVTYARGIKAGEKVSNLD